MATTKQANVICTFVGRDAVQTYKTLTDLSKDVTFDRIGKWIETNLTTPQASAVIQLLLKFKDAEASSYLYTLKGEKHGQDQ